MSKGPSPVIPLLLVTALGFLLHARSFLDDLSFLSDVEDSAYTVLLVVPVVVLLLVHQITQSLILPLVVVLTVYTVTKMFLGPLVLIVIIYFMSVYVPSYEFSQGYGGGGRRDEQGLGCVLLFAVFLGLNMMFAQGFGQWGLVLVSVLFFLLYHFQCSAY